MKNIFLICILLLLTIAKLSFAQAPDANFSADITNGCDYLIVEFTDLTTNNPTSWSWNFGDGGTSAIKNPTHWYSKPGIYTVTLTATNNISSDTEIKTAYIKLYDSPAADFEANPNYGYTPMTVNFTDLSIGDSSMSWLWNFGDGDTSILQNPTHVFNTPGLLGISLVVSDIHGCRDSIAKQIKVNSNGIDEENEFNSLMIAPNPNNGSFTVSITGINEAVELSLIDIHGQEVYNERLNIAGNYTKQLTHSDYPKGIYFLKLIGKSFSRIEKVVIN